MSTVIDFICELATNSTCKNIGISFTSRHQRFMFFKKLEPLLKDRLIDSQKGEFLTTHQCKINFLVAGYEESTRGGGGAEKYPSGSVLILIEAQHFYYNYFTRVIAPLLSGIEMALYLDTGGEEVKPDSYLHHLKQFTGPEAQKQILSHFTASSSASLEPPCTDPMQDTTHHVEAPQPPPSLPSSPLPS